MTVVEEVSEARRALVERELRLCRGWPQRLGLLLLVVAIPLVPLSVTSPALSTSLNLVAIGTIGAIGLNLSMGYAGQISLGHAFFLAVGAYTAASIGQDLGLPLPLWLLAAALVSGALGALVGLFTLRLRGPYLAIVSLGLVFFGVYLFTNWSSLTGGVVGRSFELPTVLGGLDLAALVIGNQEYTRQQGLGVLYLALAGLCLLIAHNIVRSGFGRAMLAVREQDIAAEILGVRLLRTRVVALAVGSAMGGVAGALLANELQYFLPSGFNLDLSIQYVAMIVIGGMATTFGPALGAIFVSAVPQLINTYAEYIPLVKDHTAPGFGVSKDNMGLIVYGVLIIVTLLAEPRGIAGLGERIGSLVRAVSARRPRRSNEGQSNEAQPNEEGRAA